MMGRRWIVPGLILLAACGSGAEAVATGEEPVALQADKVVSGMRHFITAHGIRQALLLADSAYFYDDNKPIDLRKIDLTIYRADGEVAATVTAETAQIDPRTEAMDAKGNVVVISPSQDQRIESDELHYNPAEDRLWSDRPTTFIREGKITRGEGFTSDGRGQNVKVIKPSGHVDAPKLGI